MEECLLNQEKVIKRVETNTNTNPPDVGLGFSCELLSLGISIVSLFNLGIIKPRRTELKTKLRINCII